MARDSFSLFIILLRMRGNPASGKPIYFSSRFTRQGGRDSGGSVTPPWAPAPAAQRRAQLLPQLGLGHRSDEGTGLGPQGRTSGLFR
jgi:hypothetical protein